MEGHYIIVPQKSGGAREALFTTFQKIVGGQGPPGLPGSATPADGDHLKVSLFFVHFLLSDASKRVNLQDQIG